MKDGKLIFQLSFMAEGFQKFCAKRFTVFSQLIFQSKPNGFSFSVKRDEAWLKDTRNILQFITS